MWAGHVHVDMACPLAAAEDRHEKQMRMDGDVGGRESDERSTGGRIVCEGCLAWLPSVAGLKRGSRPGPVFLPEWPAKNLQRLPQAFSGPIVSGKSRFDLWSTS